MKSFNNLRQRKTVSITIILASVIILLSAPIGAAAAEKGTITSVVGNPVIIHESDRTPVANIRSGNPVNGGDAIQTDSVANVIMTLVDGSEISLDTNSYAIVNDPIGSEDTSPSIFLVYGKISARIPRGARCRIATVSAVTDTKASEVAVAVAYDGTTLVAVDEGSAEVVSPNGPKVTLMSAEQTEVALQASGTSLTSTSFSGGEFFIRNWRDIHRSTYPANSASTMQEIENALFATITVFTRTDSSAERLFAETLKLADGWRSAGESGNETYTRRLSSRMRINLDELDARIAKLVQLDDRSSGYHELARSGQVFALTHNHLFSIEDTTLLADSYSNIERRATHIRHNHETRLHWVQERAPMIKSLREEIASASASPAVPGTPEKKSFWERIKPGN